MAEDIRALLAELDRNFKTMFDTYERVKNIVVVPSRDVIKVKPGDDLQAALDQLVSDAKGGTILMQPGKYWANLRLREQAPGTPRIVLTSDTVNVPAPGVRITPEFATGLAHIYALDPLYPAIEVEDRARCYGFICMAVGPQAHDRDLISLGDGRSGLRTPEQLAHDFIFDRFYAYGDPVRGQHRGIRANGRDIQILNSYLKDFHEYGRDSQAVAGWNGTANVLMENSYFEASAENVIFGGADPAREDMSPMDIIMRGCHLSKPMLWITGRDQMQWAPSVKCLFETKDAKRVLLEGNLIENNFAQSWGSGIAITIKSANQEGTAPWSATTDFTMRYNVIRRAGSFINFIARNDAGKPSAAMKNVKVHDNLFYDRGGDFTGDGSAYSLFESPEGVEIDHNTVLDNAGTFLRIGVNDSRLLPSKGLKFTNNIQNHGDYGIHAPDAPVGKAVLDLYYGPGGYEMRGNAIRKHPERTNPLPAGNVIIDRDLRSMLEENFKVKPGAPLGNVATTDGRVVGADIEKIAAMVKDWK
jgi:hypothetical protein